MCSIRTFKKRREEKKKKRREEEDEEGGSSRVPSNLADDVNIRKAVQ